MPYDRRSRSFAPERFHGGRLMRVTHLILVCALGVAAACGGTPPPRAVILQPADGDTVGPDVGVVLGAEGVDVAAADGQRVEGRGHHHLFIDGDVTPADSVIPAGVPGVVHIGTGAGEWTLTLPPGEHRIIAVLAYGNHVPMEGVASDTVRVVVR